MKIPPMTERRAFFDVGIRQIQILLDKRVDYFCHLPWLGRAYRIGPLAARSGTMARQYPVALWCITYPLRLCVRAITSLGVVVFQG